MQHVALCKAPTHAPRTGYNLAMWEAVVTCPNIGAGVPMATLVEHCMQAVPQSPHHAVAHVKYLLRQKAALTAVAAPKAASKTAK